MKEILVATTKSTYDQYKNKIDTENVVTFGIIFIFLFALLWFTLALRRENGVKRKTWKPFQKQPNNPPDVFIGKRGGRYKEDTTEEGRPYRRYF